MRNCNQQYQTLVISNVNFANVSRGRLYERYIFVCSLYERKIEVDIASRSSDRSGKQVEAAVQRSLEYTFVWPVFKHSSSNHLETKKEVVFRSVRSDFVKYAREARPYKVFKSIRWRG